MGISVERLDDIPVLERPASSSGRGGVDLRSSSTHRLPPSHHHGIVVYTPPPAIAIDAIVVVFRSRVLHLHFLLVDRGEGRPRICPEHRPRRQSDNEALPRATQRRGDGPHDPFFGTIPRNVALAIFVVRDEE
jgi:hypothetical protein